MNKPDQIKWDQRYRDTTAKPAACSLLINKQELLPAKGTALDIACGLGGNALLLAEHGLEVEAWDISPVAIEKLRALNNNIKAKAIDINAESFPVNYFDVIVVSYFLDRTLADAIIKALKPNGLLFYQTFNQNQQGRGPSNPEFRLKQDELLKLFADLEMRFYQEHGDVSEFLGEKVV